MLARAASGRSAPRGRESHCSRHLPSLVRIGMTGVGEATRVIATNAAVMMTVAVALSAETSAAAVSILCAHLLAPYGLYNGLESDARRPSAPIYLAPSHMESS